MSVTTMKMSQTRIKSKNSHERNVLRDVVKILREGDSKVDKEEHGEDSLDAQVDRFLTGYESEARASKNESGDWRRLCRRLFEADDDEETGEKAAVAADMKKMSDEDIHVDSFVTDVIHLIDNYDSLLEVKNTILRRAANYLNEHYNDDVSNEFKAAIRDQYGIEIGKSGYELDDENFPAPTAAVTGGLGEG